MNLNHGDYYCTLVNIRTRLVSHFLTIQLLPCFWCRAAGRVTGSFLRTDRVMIIWLYGNTNFYIGLNFLPRLSRCSEAVVTKLQCIEYRLVMLGIQQAVSKQLLNELMIEHSYDRKSTELPVKFCVIIKLTIQKSLKLLLRIFGTVTDQQER